MAFPRNFLIITYQIMDSVFVLKCRLIIHIIKEYKYTAYLTNIVSVLFGKKAT